MTGATHGLSHSAFFFFFSFFLFERRVIWPALMEQGSSSDRAPPCLAGILPESLGKIKSAPLDLEFKHTPPLTPNPAPRAIRCILPRKGGMRGGSSFIILLFSEAFAPFSFYVRPAPTS